MSLFDWSRPHKPLESDDLRRMGRLEAEVENLKLQWESYKDTLQRLVQRLEKRDQRAAERAAAEAPANVPQFDEEDPISARIHARRRMTRGSNGLSE